MSSDRFTDPSTLLADLEAEGADLDAVVSRDEVSLHAPTAAVGWTVGHQLAHLHWTDRLAALACTDPELFGRQRAAFLSDPSSSVDAAAETGSRLLREELLSNWRSGRTALVKAMGGLGLEARVPWLGPDMTVASLAMARIMETWAHGTDITDAFGLAPSATPRLQWVADLGVRSRNFAYRNRGLQPPADHFRVELSGPAGQSWNWGPADAANRVSGPALDFCLLVARRRHLDDLALILTGAQAQEWARIAQIFVGPPGPGRQPTRGG